MCAENYRKSYKEGEDEIKRRYQHALANLAITIAHESCHIWTMYLQGCHGHKKSKRPATPKGMPPADTAKGEKRSGESGRYLEQQLFGGYPVLRLYISEDPSFQAALIADGNPGYLAITKDKKYQESDISWKTYWLTDEVVKSIVEAKGTSKSFAYTNCLPY
jgi:hypothetical protein